VNPKWWYDRSGPPLLCQPAAQTASQSLEVADRVGRPKTPAHAPLTSTRWWWILRCAFGSGSSLGDSRDDAQLDGFFGLLKLHIEARGSLEVVDWIVLDDWYTELKRYCEILRQAPPHAEIERQE